MPDIALCENHACPIKLKCYRFIAQPSSWQAYSNFKHENCKYYEPAIPVHKLDATICVHCRGVVSVLHTKDLLCDQCKTKLTK